MAKLRRLLAAIQELQPQTWREGPFTILERYLEMTAQVLNLVAANTTDASRMVTNIASFMRFAADWQDAHPKGTLGGFVDYLDAYQQAGGELPTSVELTDDVEGVRLMTLYQAKGLEFPLVFVPALLEGEWPTKEGWSGYFPAELLARADAWRRHPHGRGTPPAVRRHHSGAGAPDADHARWAWGGEGGLALHRRDPRGGRRRAGTSTGATGQPQRPPTTSATPDSSLTLLRQVMPLPSKRERRLALRLRATELVGLLEGHRSATIRRPRGASCSGR